jgi:hypothetical protein
MPHRPSFIRTPELEEHANLDKSLRAIVREELQRVREELLNSLTKQITRGTPRSRKMIDPRKQAVAEVIYKRPQHPKLTLQEILREMDKMQESQPTVPYYRPVPSWGVRLWKDMIGNNKASVYISKIRHDPKYMPPD